MNINVCIKQSDAKTSCDIKNKLKNINVITIK